ncbi:MAG: sigma-70 family RNA polymerase sigma factor [Prevotellaceae bacterium]|jgi:RNA polymerase sigma-70 factor (ECF subfamily)|nr:sigma-70 family RNA polymerase sigma factor [Prevotellaceae bacterium]
MTISETQLQQMLANPQTREKAFSEMVRMYQERLYWHVRKMVLSHDNANDVLQNTFIKAWNGVESFRGESQLSTWLYRIATNESLTFLSNKHMRATLSNTDYEDEMLQNLTADSYFDGSQAEFLLQKAILTLPDKQRLVFNMKYFDDITYNEMEKILGTSVGALKASFHHAVKKITDFILNEEK